MSRVRIFTLFSPYHWFDFLFMEFDMNHIYRVIFNTALGVWQCVSEIARAKGKSKSSKTAKALLLGASMTVGGMAWADVAIDNNQNITGSVSYGETVNIASQVDGKTIVNVTGKDAMLSMDAGSLHENWIGVGERGHGVLNVDGGRVNSSDSVILGVKQKTDSNAFVGTKYSLGEVNLKNGGRIDVTNSLIVADGGNANLNMQTGATIYAGSVSMAHLADTTAKVDIIGTKLASGDTKTGIYTTGNLVSGDEGRADITVREDGTIAADTILINKDSTINAIQGGNLNVGNIVRSGNGSGATLSFDEGDIKAHRHESDFFGGFTSSDTIRVTNGLEFNTQNFDVTINPNAVITGNFGRVNLDNLKQNNRSLGGLEKTGKGKLTIAESTIKNVGGDFAIGGGTLQINGNHTMKAGDLLVVGINDRNDYGKFHVSGNANISEGKLNMIAADVVKALITGTNPTAEYTDVVKAGKLIGQFKDYAVLDRQGSAITTTLTPVYENNSVHLRMGKTDDPTQYPVNGENGTVIDTKGQTINLTDSAIKRGVDYVTITNGGTVNVKAGDKHWRESRVESGTLRVDGDYKLAGDKLSISLNSLSDYGKLHVNGKVDVRDADLDVAASDVVRALITSKDPSASWRDVIKGTSRVGELSAVNLLDKNHNKMTTHNLVADYSDSTAVHLKVEGASTPSTPPTNPVVPPVAPPVNPTPPANPPVTSVGTFAEATKHTNQTSSLAIALALDKILASGNGLGTALDMHIQDLHIQNDSQALTELVQSLQPAMNAQATHVVSEQQNIATQAVIDRVFGARLDTTQGSDNDHRPFRRGDDVGSQVWVQGLGIKHKMDAKNSFAGYDGNSYGLIVGADSLVGDGLRLGAALSYSDSDVDSVGTVNHQNLKSDNIQAFIYGDYAATGETHYNGFVSYGRSDVKTERRLSLAGISDIAKGEYDANILQAGVGIDHRIGSHDKHVSPYAQLRYTRIKNDGYTEQGGLAQLNFVVDKQTYDSLKATLGVHFAQPLSERLGVVGHLAGHVENADDLAVNTSFATMPSVSFTETGRQKKKFSVGTGMGLRYQMGMNTEITGQYAGEFRSGAKDHGAVVMVKWKY